MKNFALKSVFPLQRPKSLLSTRYLSCSAARLEGNVATSNNGNQKTGPLRPKSIFASAIRSSKPSEQPKAICLSSVTKPLIKHDFTMDDTFSLLAGYKANTNRNIKETLNKLIEQNQVSRNWLRNNRRMNGTMPAQMHHEQIPNGVGVIHIHAGRNNTICTLTDWQHKVLTNVSGGMCGLKGHNRGTAESGTRAASKLAMQALRKGFRDVFVVMKGFGPGRDAAFRSLMASGLEIRRISDRTPIQHGGCKPRKARRV